MENTFNLKKFLAEGVLLKEENEGNMADFLNQHKDEVFAKIVKPTIDWNVEDENITPEELTNMSDYIQDKWIDCETSNASDDPNKVASYAIDFPDVYWYYEISSVPYPGKDEITYAQGEEPQEIEIAGRKLYLFSTRND